jgi:drug/metabolite transporter (DMT)-like permease
LGIAEGWRSKPARMSLSPPEPNANRRGILAMVAAMALFIVNDTCVKLTTGAFPTSQILVVRGAITTLVLAAMIVAMGHAGRLSVLRRPIVRLRAGLEGISSALFITALAVMPLATLTAVLMASPLVITILSVIWFGEKVGWRRWSAIAVGFLGTMFIVKPSPSGIDVWALVGLLTAVIVGFRDTVTRRLDPATPSVIVAFASSLAVMAVGVALVPWQPWAPMAWKPVLLLAVAGVFLAGGLHLATVAFRGVEVSVVSPFRYTIVLWSLIIGYLVFNELPDGWALVGTALIVGAGLYTLHREQVRRRAAEAART